jgi:hypothetical protein
MAAERGGASMKRIHFFLGLGFGFVLGSKAGRGPYEQLEGKLRDVFKRPEVQSRIEDVRSVAKERAGTVADKVVERLPGSDGAAAKRADDELDAEVEGTFPSSDPPSTWAGGDA